MAEGIICRRGGGGIPQSINSAFAYTGRKRYEQKVMDGKLYHLFTFETSGALTVTGSFTGDIWICGAGGNGGYYSPYSNSGVAGGGGGYTANFFNQDIISGEMLIGGPSASEGGQGGTSWYINFNATGGWAGGNGGNGGGGGYWQGDGNGVMPPGTGQGSTTRPFQSQDMPPMCGGGPGYGMRTNYVGGNGGSDGGNGTPTTSGTQGLGVSGMYGGGSMTRRNNPSAFMATGVYGGGSVPSAYAGDMVGGQPGAIMIRIPA